MPMDFAQGFQRARTELEAQRLMEPRCPVLPFLEARATARLP